jgi:ADP-heptose:LPS heptosyltransferase
LHDLKKILIIRFSSIGDIVLTTPIVRCLKDQLPGTEIHYLTKKQFLPVIRENPHIDKFYAIEKDIDEVIPLLRKENYAHIVDLHKNLRSLGVKLRLKKPSTSFNKLNIKKWVLVNFKINRLPDIHIVDRYFGAVKSLGVKNDGNGLEYYIPEGDKVHLNDLPESHRNGFIGFVIGGKHFTKMLPEEKVISLCRKLSRPVILLGGPEDELAGRKIQEKSGDKVFNACGKFNINQSASLVRQAGKIITNDTGLMHIAAAFKKVIVSVWGNTIPEFGMYPYLPEDKKNLSTIAEIKGLACRPCSKIGFKKCPKGHFKCMMEIDEVGILNVIND